MSLYTHPFCCCLPVSFWGASFLRYQMHPDNFQYIPKKGNGYVYKITSGQKRYIGISTTPFSVRWEKHKAPWSGCKKLVKQLRVLKQRNQWSNLRVDILQESKNQNLDRLQKMYIKKYSSYNTLYGLNLTPGGRQTKPQKTKRKAKRKSKAKYQVFSWQNV